MSSGKNKHKVTIPEREWDEELEHLFPRLPVDLRHRVLQYIEDHFTAKDQKKH